MRARGLWALALVGAVLGGCGDEQEFLTVGGCEIRPGTNCPGVNLSDQQLVGANLSGGRFRGARFDRSDLSGANFSRADLTDVSFRDAKLTNANFIDARVEGANFIGADLFGARGLPQDGGCRVQADCGNGRDCVQGECVNVDMPPGECLELREPCRVDGLPCCGALTCVQQSPDFSICEDANVCFTDEDCPPDRSCVEERCETF